MNMEFKKETDKATTISVSIPAIVVGVLIALKHIGMTSMTYGSIIWFGIEVWLVCIGVALAIIFVFWLIALILNALF